MKIFLVRIISFFQSIISIFKSKSDLVIENAVLRRQLIAFKKQQPRPQITRIDRLFWVLIRITWKKWKNNLIIVKPDTVVRWHRKLFKLFWKYKSSKMSSLEKALLKKEIRRMVLKIAAENPSWGAPRIQGEMHKLGFRVSERTVSRILRKHRGPKRQKGKNSHWLTFLRNHRPAIAAMDFFIVPTLYFKPLYCFFVIHHQKRRVLLFNATFHPSAEWVREKLRPILTTGHKIRYIICDRDSIFSALVKRTLESFGIDLVRTSYKSPWQNGIAERFIGSVRRELLAHVIVLNAKHMIGLMNEYLDYYHNDRTHYALNKDSPLSRPIQMKPAKNAKLLSIPKVGGIHHRYFWQDAA